MLYQFLGFLAIASLIVFAGLTPAPNAPFHAIQGPSHSYQIVCTGELVGGYHSTIEDLHGRVNPDGSFVGWLTYKELNGTKLRPLATTGFVVEAPTGVAAEFNYRDKHTHSYKNQSIKVTGPFIGWMTGLKMGFPEPDSIDWAYLEERYQSYRAVLWCSEV